MISDLIVIGNPSPVAHPYAGQAMPPTIHMLGCHNYDQSCLYVMIPDPMRYSSQVAHLYAGQSLPPLSTCWEAITMISHVSMLWYQIPLEIPAKLLILWWAVPVATVHMLGCHNYDQWSLYVMISDPMRYSSQVAHLYAGQSLPPLSTC